MKVPFRLFVRLPDGTEHSVATIHMSSDGTVRRITTHTTLGAFTPWYDIEGSDLDEVTLITYYPPKESDE